MGKHPEENQSEGPNFYRSILFRKTFMSMEEKQPVPVQRIPSIHLQLVRGASRSHLENETEDESPPHRILRDTGGYFGYKT